MSVLILGYGYIGAALARLLTTSGERVVALDNYFSTPGPLAQAAAGRDGVELLTGDITDRAAIRRALQRVGANATVYLLAAQPSADPAAAPPELTERVNLTGPRLVYEEAATAGAARLVYASSMRVYGRYPAGLVTEDRPFGIAPDLPHLTKTYAEHLFAMLAQAPGPVVASARLGLVYGVGPIMKTDPRFMTAPNRFCRAVATGEPIQLRAGTGNTDSLLHVEDAASGLAAAARHLPASGHHAVNLAGEPASIRKVGRLVAAIAAARGRTVALDDQGGDEPGQTLEVRSRLTELGWSPRRALPEGLAATVEYFLSHAE